MKPTVNDLLTRLVGVALVRHRAVNATFTGEEIHRHPGAHVGMAVAAPNGLVVPVIRDADRRSVQEIARARADLVGRARDGKLTLPDMEGGTFTISNLGMFGVEQFVAVLNPPQVAILAVGAVKETPVVVDGEVDVAPIMQVDADVRPSSDRRCRRRRVPAHARGARRAAGARACRRRVAVVVRRGGAQDVRFLRDMLHHAYYWKERKPDAGPGPVQLYVKAWGRPGDTAVIALVDGFPVGAAWFRLFKATAPGYGFVDEQTPELAVAVVPNARGKGVGSALLDALLDRARDRRLRRAQPQRRPHNEGAIALYEQYGFEPGRGDGRLLHAAGRADVSTIVPARYRRKVEPEWNVTSPSSEAGRPDTRLRFARRNWAARSSASSRSRSSAARACESGASRRRPGCRPRTRSTTRARRSRSSVSASPSLNSTSVRPPHGRTASSSR